MFCFPLLCFVLQMKHLSHIPWNHLRLITEKYIDSPETKYVNKNKFWSSSWDILKAVSVDKMYTEMWCSHWFGASSAFEQHVALKCLRKGTTRLIKVKICLNLFPAFFFFWAEKASLAGGLFLTHAKMARCVLLHAQRHFLNPVVRARKA